MERIEVECDHNGPEFARDPAGVLKALADRAPAVHARVVLTELRLLGHRLQLRTTDRTDPSYQLADPPA